MDIEKYLSQIPPSQSDLLLQSWGYDLVREYFFIAKELPNITFPVIELATGTGRMCSVLCTLFPSVISGDISLKDLPRVHQRIPKSVEDRIQFLQLDMEHLPFPDGSIHSLVCMNTIHEVSDPTRCINEMIRVVHNEGTLILGDFNRKGLDAMQKIHETVYHNSHEEGIISVEDIAPIVSASFQSFRTLPSLLNTTYIASKKRSIP